MTPRCAKVHPDIGFLPRLDLCHIPVVREFVEAKRPTNVCRRIGLRARGSEIEEFEVDCAVTHPVDMLDRAPEIEAGKRALMKLVGILVEEPVRIQFKRELLLTLEDVGPLEDAGVRAFL